MTQATTTRADYAASSKDNPPSARRGGPGDEQAVTAGRMTDNAMAGPRRSPSELWTELGATMRSLRRGMNQSLRQVERQTDWGRGTLSQIENGKGRPSRAQVEWYDSNLNGDGLLISMYAEARGAHRLDNRRPGLAELHIDGDAFEVVRTRRPVGEAVPIGVEITAGWTLRNSGSVRWTDRRLARVGAHNAIRLLASLPWVAVPNCAPGDEVELTVQVTVPTLPGTLAAYWQMIDSADRRCFPAPSLLPVIISAV